MTRLVTALSVFSIALFLLSSTAADKPCVPRKYNHSSVVCVCNADYCDEISKIQPLSAGKYVVYTSSMDGLRFARTGGNFKKTAHKTTLQPVQHTNSAWAWLVFAQQRIGNATIQIKREQKHQKIIGFGGAFTDAAGINIKSLSEKAQRKLMHSYFSENGLEYNMGRVPIGGCDFSTYPYAYNMKPENDTKLSNFSLTYEDFTYKIPFIQEALALATDDILLTSAAWSPPVWMKTNGRYEGESRLLRQYYQTWADYHLKFLENYAKNGIPFWGMSTGNEPIDGIVPVMAFNSLGWMPTDQAEWVANNLGPTIRNSEFSDIKLLALDDQRLLLPWWIQYMANVNKAMDYIDGIATHWYWDDVIPVNSVDRTREMFPNKFLISTEACIGDKPWQLEKVELGSWSRAESYTKDIMEVMNHYYTGWIDWNLALDKRGGPNWVDNFVDSTIIVMPEADEFLKQPIFYALGHFSKFIPRNSTRVSVNNLNGQIDNVAFLRPDGGIVIVMYNPSANERIITIEEEEKGSIEIKAPARSIQSVVYW